MWPKPKFGVPDRKKRSFTIYYCFPARANTVSWFHLIYDGIYRPLFISSTVIHISRVNTILQNTYVSVFVHLVVGEFDLLEGHDLFAKLIAGERRVRVRVQPVRSGRVRLAGHQPRRTVVRVPVPLVVHRYDVHEHRIPLVGPQAGEWHSDRREHPPVDRNITRYTLDVINGFHGYR